MKIERIVNSFLQSNTFILSEPGENDVYLVDVGDIEPLMERIGNKNVSGVFLTHAHYDHIYGINRLIDIFPDCTIYGSRSTLMALKNDKLNFSYYYEKPLLYKGTHEEIVKDGGTLYLWGKNQIRSLMTPGHTLGSTCYIYENNIFTGDAYIPNVPVVTKLKEGDKVKAEKSVETIQRLLSEGTVIHPGHLFQYKMTDGILQPICTIIE